MAGAVQPVPHAPQLAGSLIKSTHDPAQDVGVGVTQPLEQVPPEQIRVLPTHARVQLPHVSAAERSASQPLPGVPSQSAKPGEQSKPQAAPSHVATELAGATQGEQLVPQEESELLGTQTSPQRWKPARHANPQATPSQVASAFGGGAHGEQAAPHVAVAASGTHAPPQR